MSLEPDQAPHMRTPIRDWGPLGLGTGTLASLGRAASVADVRRLLETMEDLGIHTIDTADSYASGECERLMAKALSGRRARFRIITKAGYRYGNLSGPLRHLNQFLKKGIQRLGYRQNFETSYLRHCLDQSLRRLNTVGVDAFLLHDPPLEVIRSSSVQQLFQNVKKNGEALQTGISSGDADVLEEAVKIGLCDLIETPASIRAAEWMIPIWKVCEVRGIHVIGNHVFDPACLLEPGTDHERLMRASAALLPKGSTILCGTRNPEHLRSSHEWALTPLPCEEALRVAGIGPSLHG